MRAFPSLSFPTIPVRRVDDGRRFLANQGFEELEAPVVLGGVASDCPLFDELRSCASARERLRHMGRLIADVSCRYHASRTPEMLDGAYIARGARRVSARGARFAADAQASLDHPDRGPVYLKGMHLSRFPRVAERVDRSMVAWKASYPVLWIGTGDHTTPLHADPDPNLVLMFAGRKRFLLLPPDAVSGLYPAPWDRALAGGDFPGPSLIHFLVNPDFERFPRLRAVLPSVQEVILEPGDALFMPPLWWHHVEARDVNVMVSIWSDDPACFAEVTLHFSEGLRLLAKMPAPVRLELRACVQRFFEGAPLTWTAPSIGADVISWGRGLEALWPALGTSLRAALPSLYDYFVFQSSGDPFPTQPGALDRLLRRYHHLARARSLWTKRQESFSTWAPMAFHYAAYRAIDSVHRRTGDPARTRSVP